jgi:hypothetical protein
VHHSQGDELLTLKNTHFFTLVVFLFSAFGLVSQAMAFQPATISNEFAQVKQTADPNAATTSTLPKGTRVNTSDKPTNGFYKIRAATASGWVAASDLAFGSQQVAATGRPKRRHKKQKYQWEVKIFTGLNFWTPSDINNLVGSSSLNMGTGLGAEVGYAVNNRLNIVLRIEHLSKSSTGTDTDSNNNVEQVELDYSATPIMVGADYTLLPGDTLSLDGSALIGLASPSLNGLINSSTAATFSGSAPALLIKADLNWLVGENFWLFGELGYRYLQTKQVQANNYNVTLNSTTGQYQGPGTFFYANNAPVPIALNMSGPVFNIGARLNF